MGGGGGQAVVTHPSGWVLDVALQDVVVLTPLLVQKLTHSVAVGGNQ